MTIKATWHHSTATHHQRAHIKELHWLPSLNSLGSVMAYACILVITTGSSENGSSPVWCQTNNWSNADLMSIKKRSGTKFSPIHRYNNLLWKNCIWKCHLQNVIFCSGLNVVTMKFRIVSHITSSMTEGLSTDTASTNTNQIHHSKMGFILNHSEGLCEILFWKKDCHHLFLQIQ